MALCSNCFLNTSSFRFPKSKTLIPQPHSFIIYSQTSSDSQSDDCSERRRRIGDLLAISVSLTVVSTAFVQKRALAAKAVKKKAKSSAALVVLSPEEVKSWVEGLPIMAEKIPFTDVLEFSKRGELKHVIKSPTAAALKEQQHPESVLVVLLDSRVFRTVLPLLDGNRRFWDQWKELNIDAFCVNSYTPPVKKPELPTPTLWFMAKVPEWMAGFTKKKPVSKRALEFKKMRLELEKKKKKEELERMQQVRNMIEKAIKRQKKEDRRAMLEMRRKKHERELREARKS